MYRVVCIDPSDQSHNASGKYPIMYQKGTLWDMGLVYCGIYARCQLQRQDVPYNMNTLRDLNKVTEILSCLLSTENSWFFSWTEVCSRFIPGDPIEISICFGNGLVTLCSKPFPKRTQFYDTIWPLCNQRWNSEVLTHSRAFQVGKSQRPAEICVFVADKFSQIVAISHGNLQLIYQITNTRDRRQLDIDPRLSRRIDISWIDIDSRVFSILDHNWTWVCLYMAKTSGCREKKNSDIDPMVFAISVGMKPFWNTTKYC